MKDGSNRWAVEPVTIDSIDSSLLDIRMALFKAVQSSYPAFNDPYELDIIDIKEKLEDFFVPNN